ncbi:MAG TPA: BatA domain-containing protein [Gemmatimonadales bacterium]
MSFLHPLALLGLAAAAIPALLHLLQRRVPPALAFPPVRYLREAERRSARRLRLRHLLLLVLRTALIAAVVTAAARPLVPVRRGPAGHAPSALAIVLDNSISAAAIVDGHPVLDRLKAVALATLARAGATDRLWLMLADGVARAGSAGDLTAAVRTAAADPHRLDLSAAVERAAALVEATPFSAREVDVIADGQAGALGPLPANVPAGVRVQALAPARAALHNRGVAGATVIDNRLAVAIGGTPGTPPAPVTVTYRGRIVARALGAPGDTLDVALPPAPPGWWAGSVSLEPDELRADDARPFVARVSPPARVAIAADAGPFLRAAVAVLREAGRIVDGADIAFGVRPGAHVLVVSPPGDPALRGQLNRLLAARGTGWRFGAPGTPGPLVVQHPALGAAGGASVSRRYQLTAGPTGTVLATVNGQPWAVRDTGVILLGSVMDTAWTALPASPGFVPFVDALANAVARAETPVIRIEGSPAITFTTRPGSADTTGAAEAGIDARESDLTPAASASLARVLHADVVSGDAFAGAAFAGQHRMDASGWLLLLGLLLACAEFGVATLSD